MQRNEQLLREAIRTIIVEKSNDVAAKRAMNMIKEFMKNAQDYVDSVVAGNANNALAKKMNKDNEDLNAFVSWLSKNNIPWAENMKTLHDAAKALTKRSGFWNTPKFLNVPQHVEEVKNALSLLKQAALQAWRTINGTLNART